MRRIAIAVSVLGGILAASAAEESAGEALFKKVDPSVVLISHENALGSGFIVSEDGYIISNGHVVMAPDPENPHGVAKRITVTLHNDRKYSAQVVGHCLDPDISLIKIDLAPGDSPLVPVPFGDSDQVRVGQACWAFGAPKGLKRTLTAGIVSNVERTDMGTYVPILQMDAAINPGNSGGPLFNEQGEVIGVNTYGGGGEALAFSIPSNIAKVMREHYLRYGRFRRAALKTFVTQAVDEAMGRALGVDGGVLVAHVVPGSQAEKAGLRAGDVIRSVDGAPVAAKNEADRLRFNWSLVTREVGSELALEVLRKGEALKLQARLEEDDPLPRAGLNVQGMELASCEIPHEIYEGLGLAVQQVNTRSRLIFNLPDAEGVLVTSVGQGSAAQRAGLQGGELLLSVEGVPTPDPAAFRAAMEASFRKGSKAIRFAFRRGKDEMRSAFAPRYLAGGKRVLLLGNGEWKEVVRRHLVESGAELVESLPVSEGQPLDGLVLVGGVTEWCMGGNGDVSGLVKTLVSGKKVVAALGDSPVALLQADPALLEKKVTAAQESEEAVMALKANYTGKAVERDGKLVTGRGKDKPEAKEFVRGVVKALSGG